MTKTEQRAGWTVTGSHVVLTADFVRDLQAAVDDLLYAHRIEDDKRATLAGFDLHILINHKIGQFPGKKATG